MREGCWGIPGMVCRLMPANIVSQKSGEVYVVAANPSRHRLVQLAELEKGYVAVIEVKSGGVSRLAEIQSRIDARAAASREASPDVHAM